MTREKSCGAIVYTRDADGINYIMIESLEGFFGFPKWHMETGESETETAAREIYEEIGLRPRLITQFRMTDEHMIPGKDVMKEIVYFLAEDDGKTEPQYQKAELLGVYKMSFDEAYGKLKFDRIREILRAADEYIRTH